MVPGLLIPCAIGNDEILNLQFLLSSMTISVELVYPLTEYPVVISISEIQ